MDNKIDIRFLSQDITKSNYDWANLYNGNEMVGKSRCKKKNNEIIIYSIMIFPEYQGNDYGKIFINQLKFEYDKIIADRVRNKAIGFWKKMGFIKDGTSQYSWKK